MSKKRIINALKKFELSTTDIQVYVFLAKQGPAEMSDLASMLNLNERKIHSSLKDLRNLGIVKASNGYPQELIAVPFEEAIDLLVEVRKEQAKAIQEAKDELLCIWQKMTKEKSEKI